MSKFKCGKCFQGYDDLQAFGEHLCLGDNPALAAIRGVIHMGGYTVDLSKIVEEAIQRHRVSCAIDNLEHDLRRAGQ